VLIGARARIRLGEHSDALPDLLMAEKDSPAEPTIHYLLASVYRVLGNTAEASREMQTFEQLKRKGIVIGPGYFEQR
jgi:predicted Zn-dependent protease